ncbi:MAG: tetratricopeptide repeat protein [Rhodospirillaceae bacterium]|nr:tetratricopeptide repeat protein [Rhodospirillaceae bacterium]
MRPTLDQAVTLHRAGQTADAERRYEEIIASSPDSVPARHGLGVLLLQTGRPRHALTHLSFVAERQSEDAGVLNALGAAQMQIGEDAGALKSFQSAISHDPNHSLAAANLGVLLLRLNDPMAATEMLERAVKIDPSNTEAQYNYSRALSASGRLTEAVNAARQVVALSPESADAHHHLGQTLLKSGHLAEGWPAFEWRWKTKEFRRATAVMDVPQWDGQSLSEGVVLLWAEQGVGDQVLYASMMHETEGMTPRILIACMERLVPLFARSFPFAKVQAIEDLTSDQATMQSLSAQLPVGDLGRLLRPDMTSFPDRSSYLVVDQSRADVLKKRYRSDTDDRPVIGLSWRSSNPRYSSAKSMELVDLADAFSDTEATFIDLQYGDTSGDRAAIIKKGFDIFRDSDVDPLTDLDGFAAQVGAMDLVVTTSNTTAHIAGALGVPCWVLVPAGAGGFWYWFLDRDDSPWYPSIRLFRQVTPGVWADTINDVRAAFNR